MVEQWIQLSFQVSTLLPTPSSLSVLCLPLNVSKSFSSLMGKAVPLCGVPLVFMALIPVQILVVSEALLFSMLLCKLLTNAPEIMSYVTSVKP